MIRTIRVVLSFPVIKFFFHHLLEKIGVPLKKNQNSVSSVYKKKKKCSSYKKDQS